MNTKYLINLEETPMITGNNTMYIPITDEIEQFIVSNIVDHVELIGYDYKNRIAFLFKPNSESCASVYKLEDWNRQQWETWSYHFTIKNGIPCIDLEIPPDDCYWFNIKKISKILVTSHRFDLNNFLKEETETIRAY